MSVHEELINELLSGKVSMSPREVAAANEIISLRTRIADLEAQMDGKKSTIHEAIGASKGRRTE